MLINAAALSVLYLFAKEVTKEVSSNLVVFIYKSMIILGILPWCLYGGIKRIKTNRLLLHLSRGCMSAMGSLCLFYAIKNIPLADVTAIGYLEQVLWAVIGVAVFGEALTSRKIISITMGFMGAILVVYPNLFDFKSYDNFQLSNINSNYIFVFLSIIFWSINCTIVKILGKTEASKVQLFYSLIFQVIITAPFAFLGWQETEVMGFFIKKPTGFIDFTTTGLNKDHSFSLVILSICYFVHSFSFFLSLKNAEFSIVVPFDYFRILFGAVLGYIFFSEIPAKENLIGYSLIAASGICFGCAEARHKRRMRQMQIKQLEEELEHA